MTAINAYVGFNGQCREAMNFYKDILGGELSLMTVAETPMAEQCPESMQQHIMHSMLTSGSIVLMGTDMVRGEFIKGNNMALSLNCSSDEEIEHFFTKLSEGGHVDDALAVMFWGDKFASFSDKFGIKWMLNYGKSMS